MFFVYRPNKILNTTAHLKSLMLNYVKILTYYVKSGILADTPNLSDTPSSIGVLALVYILITLGL